MKPGDLIQRMKPAWGKQKDKDYAVATATTKYDAALELEGKSQTYSQNSYKVILPWKPTT